MKSSTKTTLIILSTSYPFDDKEPLLPVEVEKLSKSFDYIKIICIGKFGNKVIYNLPENTQVIKYNNEELSHNYWYLLKLIFNHQFWLEIFSIPSITGQPLALGHLKTIYNSYNKAKHFSKYLKQNIPNWKYEKTYYSYWTENETIGVALTLKKGEKLYTRMHGYDLYFERHPNNYLPFRKVLLHKLSGVFFISEQGKNYFTKKFDRFSKKYFIVRLGTMNHSLPSKYKESKTISIVSCSSVIPLKRIHLIINALAYTKNSINIEWTHFGGGGLLEDLKRLAQKKLDPKNSVNYNFKGHLKNSEIQDFYKKKQVDLFINVSETEGIPISIMEANSFGIPAIATDVGGVSELVNNENGNLIDKDATPKEIAEIIENYSSLNIDERNKLRLNAYKKWNSEYNAEKNIEKLVKLLSS